MKIFLAFLAWFTFCFAASYWMASEHHKPEVEALELSRHGPARDCDKFKGDAKAYAACFGYK